ncbi:hypothetical protein ES703_55684 [subsurface metagenome]
MCCTKLVFTPERTFHFSGNVRNDGKNAFFGKEYAPFTPLTSVLPPFCPTSAAPTLKLN